MSQPEVTIIFNPRAGGNKQRFLSEILQHAGVKVELLQTTHPGHARELARKVRAHKRLFVAGGDGSLNEALNGLLDAQIDGHDVPPIGIIPLGTANVLAVEVGLSLRAKVIADYINNPGMVWVRPGVVNGRAFFLMVGMGADADTVDNVSLRLKRLIGKGAYVLEGLRSIFFPRHRDFEVCIGRENYRASGVIVTHAKHYGGAFVISDDASLTSNQLDVLMMPGNGIWALARYGLALTLHRLHKQSDVSLVRTERLTIKSHCGPAPIQIDGENAGKLPCEISLSPYPVRLMVPTLYANQHNGPGDALTSPNTPILQITSDK
ncbi:diacylglycerol/lipid kinase family protein [Thalassospira lucentensis]|uniref:diacylglycerol/lipid kinase family protein n=1 Tax=Thalassospira lucentensis TaxID=168935 RepID=UPI00142DFE23|nr:diacylglycerol kinase family protein [Thalassospira lucentensis]NIZ01511.1 diacylglycerol kinase family lipid kinase [Thalassospira lucentensis]